MQVPKADQRHGDPDAPLFTRWSLRGLTCMTPFDGDVVLVREALELRIWEDCGK